MREKKIKQSCLSLRLTTVRTWFQPVILLVLCLFGSLSINTSRASELDQVTLKILYTYKFGKFTQWPDSKLNTATDRFQYCIIGQNPFPQKKLNMIIGKPVQGIPLAVEVFDSGLVLKEVLSGCHVVFISVSEKHRLATILASLRQTAILTISDIPEFSSYGGMITLIESQGKLRFQINPKALQQANISMSSKIMELAEIVTEGRR